MVTSTDGGLKTQAAMALEHEEQRENERLGRLPYLTAYDTTCNRSQTLLPRGECREVRCQIMRPCGTNNYPFALSLRAVSNDGESGDRSSHVKSNRFSKAFSALLYSNNNN